jgi:2-haloalkanoic acid dehalogenase type II
MANKRIKAVFFDFMGTCLDWHTGATEALPHSIPASERSELALEWRHSYFDFNAARLAAGELPEDFDLTLRKVLDVVLEKHPDLKSHFDEPAKQHCVSVWHTMQAWPDVPAAIAQLKSQGYEVYVHANGTTRLQLDLCKSAGLSFDMLFSSELLGVYKPDLESFRKALQLLRLEAEECVMVAAHAWDTRGGKAVGMKTVYIRRWSDDISEDMEAVKADHDAFLEDMKELPAVVARF